MTFTDAYTSAYRDEYGSASRTDTYITTYAGAYGTQFKQAPLDVQLGVSLGGQWTDITGYVYQRDGTTPPITVGRGRPDESSSASPGTFAAELNNRDGRFSPKNPLGAWYGQLGRNTPLRCSVPALEPYLRAEDDTLSGASCPDAPQLAITTGIDVRVDAALSSYLPAALMSKWALTGGTSGAGLVGCTVYASAYAGDTTRLQAANSYDAAVGEPMAYQSQKVYYSAGSFPQALVDGYGHDLTPLVAAGCQFWLCYRPALNGSDSAAFQASLQYWQSQGARIKVVIYQEPQNASNGFTAASYIACVQSYAAMIHSLGLKIVYNCSGGNGTYTEWTTWYPGDAYVDEIAIDFYGNNWVWMTSHGFSDPVASLQALANSSGKPFGFGEIGSAVAPATITNSQFVSYIGYIQGVMAGRLAAGLVNSDVMWFNGTSAGGANINTITGPSDFRVPYLKALYQAIGPASGGVASAQRSWALALNGDGTVSLYWTSDGTLATVTKVTSTAPVPLGRTVIRALKLFANGTTTVTFFTGPGGNAGSPGTSTPWTQLGTAVSGVPQTIFASTAPVAVGYNPSLSTDYATYGGITGQVYAAHIRSFAGTYSDTYADLYGSPVGGYVAADAGFYAQVPGTTSFTDSAGNVWSPTGRAEISQRSYRFHGELSSLPTTWDVTGTDIWAPVQAGGLLRRMGQGSQPPVDSAFKRAVEDLAGANTPVAYWPWEDGTAATQIAPTIGPAPMTFAQSPTFAADSTSFACSMPLPTMGNGAVTGPVAPYTGGTAVVVRFLISVPAGASIADDTVLARANTTGDIGDLTLRYKTGGQLRFSGYGDQMFLFDTGALSQFSLLGVPQLVSMEITKNGSGFKYAIRTLTVGSAAPTAVTGTVASGKVGNVTTIHMPGPPGVTFGHVFAQSALEPLTDFIQPLQAWAGETCANRFARLCAENGYAARVYGFPATDVAMGVQAPGTLASLLQLCEDTGRGLIFEPRRSLSLGYRTVGSLCQQAPAVVADYSQAHLGQDSSTLLQPTDDDLHTQNDVTVQDGSGTSFEAVLNDGSPMSVSAPPTGVGEYANSYTVNTAAGAQLHDIAGWILGIGTSTEDRYPAVPFNLVRAEVAPLFFALQDTDVGDYLQVLSPPAWLAPGPVKQLLYGTTESFGAYWWGMSWTTVPEAPYETGIYNDLVFGRADTDGSQLDAATPAGLVADGYGDLYLNQYGVAVAGLAVDTTSPSGILWTTLASDFPFDVIVGGEQMTVLAISGAGSPQQFSVTPGVNGITKAHQAGESVSLAHPAIEALA